MPPLRLLGMLGLAWRDFNAVISARFYLARLWAIAGFEHMPGSLG